jgi:hypothetical protein
VVKGMKQAGGRGKMQAAGLKSHDVDILSNLGVALLH